MTERKKLMDEKTYYVYAMTNWNNEVLYIGMTSNLEKRLYEHEQKLVEGFTEKYNVNKLVYFETTNSVLSAVERERQLKGWTRKKKDQLIEKVNPNWNELKI